MTLTLTLPSKALTPNARCHYMAKAKATKAYRTQAALVALAAKPADHTPWKYATAAAVFYVKDRRRRDADNALASIKALFDGLRDAGIIEDDSGLTHAPLRFEVDAKNPRVEITLTERPKS